MLTKVVVPQEAKDLAKASIVGHDITAVHATNIVTRWVDDMVRKHDPDDADHGSSQFGYMLCCELGFEYDLFSQRAQRLYAELVRGLMAVATDKHEPNYDAFIEASVMVQAGHLVPAGRICPVTNFSWEDVYDDLDSRELPAAVWQCLLRYYRVPVSWKLGLQGLVDTWMETVRVCAPNTIEAITYQTSRLIPTT